MANDTQILSALRRLSAYYGKEPSKEQARLYLEMLAELEPAALEFAVRSWIRRSPFFPRISELLEAAAQYTPPPADPAWMLFQVQYRLERKVFREGVLDAALWENLVQRFEQYGRTYSARACQERFRRYQEMLALQNNPERRAELLAAQHARWQQQADLLQGYYETQELPEIWK